MTDVTEIKADDFRDVAHLVYLAILTEKYVPGQRLPSLWKLPEYYHLSVATVARGVTEIERTRLLISERSRRRSITKDHEEIWRVKERYIVEQTVLLKKRLYELRVYP
jgi:DNA-binding transcriptional regulator YhcF (GntR family)